MKLWLVLVVVLATACKDKGAAGTGSGSGSGSAATTAPVGSAGSAAPAGSAGSAVAGKDDWDNDDSPPPEPGDDPPPPEDEEVDGSDAPVITRLCKRTDECKCPVPDCSGFFTKIGMPDKVYECIITQPCETLCAPKAGAPGTPLHTACVKGNIREPSGGGGAVAKQCRSTSECGGKHECCGGYCYEMGTSLWITACQMPTGRF